MRILLLDDSVKHRRAGVTQLEAVGHEVVALCDYTEARRMVSKERFDVALIDLLMPAEETTLGPEAIKEHVGREIGVGFPMTIELARSGIKMIACATDTNHHFHPMSAIVDWFTYGEPIIINGAKVMFMHSPMSENGTKNWGEILARLCAK